MRTYLRVINPIVAVVVLVLCLYAAFFDDGFKPNAPIKGSISMYFIAKGLFCSSALFVLGRILLVLIEKTGDKKYEDTYLPKELKMARWGSEEVPPEPFKGLGPEGGKPKGR